MADIDVRCEPAGDDWLCLVTVSDGSSVTRHRVTVARSILARLAPAATDPVELVRASFEFLLVREAKESILGSFDLPLIGRYFPEYESEIARGRG